MLFEEGLLDIERTLNFESESCQNAKSSVSC